jgi:C4-dicarboxylate transporter DctM subunit
MVWSDFYFRPGYRAGHASGGVNLFTAANLIKGDVDAVAKEAIPYVIIDVVVLIILSLLPILSLYLPMKAGLYAP